MAGYGMTLARSGGLTGCRQRMVLLLTAAAMCVSAVACTSSSATPIDHGAVIGHLHIPFVPTVTSGSADVIMVTVREGQRFSVEVDTSDGPQWWTQAGPGPDSRIVKVIGDFNVGSCPANVAGCRVPYYHTLLARSPGATTMTWRYNTAPCRAPSTSPASKQCPSVRDVQFDIDVR
jgi:hypothetical protein